MSELAVPRFEMKIASVRNQAIRVIHIASGSPNTIRVANRR
jgi:hypothetical protein